MELAEIYRECSRCGRGGANKSNQCVILDDSDVEELESRISICVSCLRCMLDFVDEEANRAEAK